MEFGGISRIFGFKIISKLIFGKKIVRKSSCAVHKHSTSSKNSIPIQKSSKFHQNPWFWEFYEADFQGWVINSVNICRLQRSLNEFKINIIENNSAPVLVPGTLLLVTLRLRQCEPATIWLIYTSRQRFQWLEPILWAFARSKNSYFRREFSCQNPVTERCWRKSEVSDRSRTFRFRKGNPRMVWECLEPVLRAFASAKSTRIQNVYMHAILHF